MGDGTRGGARHAVAEGLGDGVAAVTVVEVPAVVRTERHETEECLCQDKRAPADRANHEKARQHFYSNPSVEIRVLCDHQPQIFLQNLRKRNEKLPKWSEVNRGGKGFPSTNFAEVRGLSVFLGSLVGDYLLR
jgi:hypothetical protein